MRDNGEIPVPGALCRTLGERAWDKRVEGFDNSEIAAELGLPAPKVSELLTEEHRRQTALCSPEFFRTLNLARSERLIKTYLPLALMETVTVERIRAGQSVDGESIDHPLRCACLVLSLLRFQSELLGLRAAEVFKTDKVGPEDVLSWLRTQTEFVKQLAREAPPDVVTLPTEQLDGAQSPATETKTSGSQTYRDKLRSEAFELDVDIEIPVARAPTTGTLGGGPSGPVEDPLEAERRERRERFFRGECDAL
jgi:hypothetical protein